MGSDFWGKKRMGEERDPQTYAIIGAAMEVHRELGRGFRELPYQDALELEFGFRRIPFEREPLTIIHYKGNPLKSVFSPDFICYAAVIVELKAVEALNDDHRAQVIHYLKATGLNRGLLINFGRDRLEYERIVLNYQAQVRDAHGWARGISTADDADVRR